MSENQPKKILCIIQLPPPLHGASVMNSHVINSEIIRSNFIIDIVNLQFSKSIKELKKFSLRKTFKTLLFCYEIVKKLRSYKPDLVYFTISPVGFAFYRDSFYVFFLKLFHTKVVFHLHGKGIKKNAQSNKLKKYLYRWVFKKAYVICLSENLVTDIADVYKSKPFIVPNGIHVQNKNNHGMHQVINSIPQILYLSNFKRDKGVLILIEALGLLKDKGYNFNARLVGAPSDLAIEPLETIIRNQDLSDFVKVVGPLYGDEKFNELRNADIFVNPTYNDAFPLVIIEAYQFAIPVISTYEGGIADMVINNETGLLVKTQNPQMLADKIAILLNDNNLRRMMGKKGYERFINNYTLEHFENNLNRTFRTILGN